MAGEILGSLKTIGGDTMTLTAIASATAVTLPPNESVFTVTGSTEIATINATGEYRPGRIIFLMFTGSITVTDTALSSTAQGKIHTGSTTPADGTVLALICANNGSWWQFGYSANG